MDIIGIYVQGDILQTIVNMFTVAVCLEFIGTLVCGIKGGKV